jgi:hypothetical protein
LQPHNAPNSELLAVVKGGLPVDYVSPGLAGKMKKALVETPVPIAGGTGKR